MASRDGFVNFPLSIPQELMYLVESYQNDMKIISKSYAFRVLLESHPEIAKRAQALYSREKTQEPSGGG